MTSPNSHQQRNPLSPDVLKTIAREVAGINMTDDELRLCANRLDGLLTALRELEKIDLGELEPLYTLLMPKED